MAVEAGFIGFHGLEPAAGVDLGQVKQEFGQDLILIGNIDVRVLCDSDLQAVHREVNRCLEQGAPGGGYMIATCNSIFEGMNSTAVAEMFRFQAEMSTGSSKNRLSGVKKCTF
jgi:uroporphyrinogen decarboxylase